MVTFFAVIHVIVCLFLIIIVLLQSGKGAGMGAAFGGASQTVFGPRGAGTILSRMTAIMAGIFMLNSLVLAYFSSHTGSVADIAVQKAAETRVETKVPDAGALLPDGSSPKAALPQVDGGDQAAPADESAKAAPDGGATVQPVSQPVASGQDGGAKALPDGGAKALPDGGQKAPGEADASPKAKPDAAP